MLYTENTIKALKLAYEKHSSQFDRSGVPYIFHPYHLAEQMNDEDSVIVALLHDVVEDTDTTFDELESMGFSSRVIEALKLLTHQDSDDYFEYIKKLASDPLAKKVKIADLKHNSDLTRIDPASKKDMARVKKYNKCLDYLTGKTTELI